MSTARLSRDASSSSATLTHFSPISIPPSRLRYSLTSSSPSPIAHLSQVRRRCQRPFTYLHTHTHTRLTALFPGLPGWAGTKKAIPIWILLKHETVSGSGISWAIMQVCTSLQIDNHASTSPLKFFTGRMPFLLPTQQRQSTEGKNSSSSSK